MSSSIVTAPLLVTGAHRTGTTWIGHLLGASGEVTYLREPLNPLSVSAGLNFEPTRHYAVPTASDMDRWRAAFEQLHRFEYPLLSRLGNVRRPRHILPIYREARRFREGARAGHPPLVKDPFALLAAPWLADTFKYRVVITIRHPAGVVSSVKRLDWRLDVRSLLGMDDDASDLRRTVAKQVNDEVDESTDQVEMTAHLWNYLYARVADWQVERPEWIFAIYEDWARSPDRYVENAYRRLGLTWSEEVSERIVRLIDGAQGELPVSRRHDVNRNSESQINLWKDRLTDQESKTIQRITQTVAETWYPPESWDK